MLVGSLAGLATQIINLFCPEQSLSLSFSLQFHSNNQQLWAICEIFISVPMAAFQHSHATHQTQMGVFVFSDQYWLGFIFLLDWYKYLYREQVCLSVERTSLVSLLTWTSELMDCGIVVNPLLEQSASFLPPDHLQEHKWGQSRKKSLLKLL